MRDRDRWIATGAIVLAGLAGMVVAIGTSGCASPAGPTPRTAMAEWALAHINDTCISQAEGGRGQLIPNEMRVPEGWTVRPISYCNPAE